MLLESESAYDRSIEMQHRHVFKFKPENDSDNCNWIRSTGGHNLVHDINDVLGRTSAHAWRGSLLLFEALGGSNSWCCSQPDFLYFVKRYQSCISFEEQSATMSTIPDFKHTPIEELSKISGKLRATYNQHKTKPIEFRLIQLRKLWWG